MVESILIVDDNEVNRQLVRLILTEKYPDTKEAVNGEQCLDILAQGDINLVLLDLNMPVRSGFDVLEELRSWNDKRIPPVIVVSAEADPATISRAFHLGAADYVTTPFNRDELLARVHTHLTLAQREQSLEESVQARTAELMETNRRLKETYGQLIQAEKMASLGQLAAGVAHEINNPLAYINSNLKTLQGYADDLLEMLSVLKQASLKVDDAQLLEKITTTERQIDLKFIEEDIRHLVTESMQGVERVNQIVADLKGFSHPEQEQWQAVDIHQIIESALNIAHNQLKYKAKIIKDYGKIPVVQCIVPQISQVLLNLLVNAGQAINKQGTITIETRNNHFQGADGITIRIIDTGQGIAEDVLNKIFDPFFTTKPVGEGTGLGLSVSYGIIQNHHGNIEVSSQPGQGTSFCISLPATQKQEHHPAAEEVN